MNKWIMITGVVCALLFVVLVINADSTAIAKVDQTVGDSIRGLQSDTRTGWMDGFSYLGGVSGFIGVLIVSFMYIILSVPYHKGMNSLYLVVTFVVAYGLNTVLKSVLHRERPSVDHLVSVDGYSMPSGNAMISIALYGFVMYLLCTYVQRAWLRGIGSVVLIFVILGIGFSRIYYGVHYPTDMVSGYLAGGAIIAICIYLHRSYLRQFSR